MTIKLTNKLMKNPVVCYSAIRDYMYNAGEDFLDQNCTMFKVPTFLLWLCGKGYITNEKAEEMLEYNCCIHELLLCDGLFGEDTLINGVKAYTLLAEYCSIFKNHRDRLLNALSEVGIESIESVCLLNSKELTKDVVESSDDAYNIEGYTYADEYEYFSKMPIV